MPKTKTTYVVIQSYTDDEGDAIAEVLYAGDSKEAAVGAVKAFNGQQAYHEGHAQVAVQAYPDNIDADGLPFATLKQVEHQLFWEVKEDEA